MANIYYNGIIDKTWNTIGNWWTNSSYTTPAGHIPQAGDTVYIDAEMDTGPTVSISLNLINIGTIDTIGALPITLTANALCDVIFNNNYYFFFGVIENNATFNNASYVNGANINGNAIFNDTSYLGSCTVGGNVTCNNSSSIQGGAAIQGNATLNDTSYMNLGLWIVSIAGSLTFGNNNVISATINATAASESGSGSVAPSSYIYPSAGSTTGINGSSILGLV